MMIVKKILLVSSVLIISNCAEAQSGCTDPYAINYDASAKTNDGSCLYPVTHKSPAFRATLSTNIAESSGLVWTDDKLWTHNDSGNPAYIFSIDTATGKTLQTVVIDNYPNVDWEDITADSNYIYVGDHGNNNGDRRDLKILKIAKADITSDSIVHVNAQAIAFSYSDQTSFVASKTNNFDCEALIAIQDSLYVFTKDRGDLSTRVYKMPKIPGTYVLNPYTSYNVNGLITGVDYDAAKKEIILVGYMSGHTNSFLWYLNDFQGDLFFSGNKRRIEIGNGTEWQTEGITYISNDRFLISCETAGSIKASLYTCDKEWNTTLIKNDHPAAWCTIYPNPSADKLYIDHAAITSTYIITNTTGQITTTGTLDTNEHIIMLNRLAPGNYIITLKDQNGASASVRFEKRN